MAVTRFAFVASALTLFATFASCNGAPGPVTPGVPEPGATSFVSQPPGGACGEKAALNDSPGAASTGGGAAAAPTRAIQESDLYAVSGNTLYVLNTFRGLMIVDMSDLAAPQLVARVPIVGTPVGLYLEGTMAYVVVSDRFFYD